MSYRGHVKDGVIVLDEPANLEEGAPVRIEILRKTERRSLHPDIKKFTGVIPPDIDVRAEYAQGVLKR